MKKTLFLLPLIHLFVAPDIFAIADRIENRIKLDSPIIKMADGSLIKADEVECMKRFRRTMLSNLAGELQPNGERIGKYKFRNKYHGIQSLASLEKEVKESKNAAAQTELASVLAQAKTDFIEQSHEFIESSHGSKSILTALIQEDCQKRGRPNSLLLEWAKTKEGQESVMFENSVRSFNDYYHFCTDLVNFLLDLIHSCPKAESQFRDRVAKWSAVKEILPLILKKAHVKADHINEIEFLKYLKEQYLDHMTISEITQQTILPLLTEYIKHTKNYA